MLLQAAQYDNYSSVASSLVTEKCICSVTGKAPPPPLAYFPFAVHCCRHPTRAHAFHFAITTLISLHDSVNVTLSHPKLWNHKSSTFPLADATSQHSIITRIVQRISDSLFDTDLKSLNLELNQTCPYRLLRGTSD